MLASIIILKKSINETSEYNCCISIYQKVKVSFIVNSATCTVHTCIQRIEIALLSYSLVHTDNTKHKQ